MPGSFVPVRVVDASALVELLLNTDLGRRVSRELRGHALTAPAHADAEVLSAIGRLTRAREVSVPRAEAALLKLAQAPIRRYPVHPLLASSWRLRNAVSLRDAIYVALARSLDATIVTTDGALSRVPGHGVAVTLVRV
jgi:predicted nucleic acid-binding protein